MSGFHQPAGWAERATISEPGAPHQMQLIIHRALDVAVTCTCLVRFKKRPIAKLRPADDPHAIYATHRADGAA